MKTCKGCKIEFPKTLEHFYRDRKYLMSRCKVCYNALNKARREANPGRRSAVNKAWREANPDKVRKAVKAWRDANPNAIVRASNRRRAKRLGNGFEKYTLVELFKIYGTNCYLCDMPINLEVSGQISSNPRWRSGLHVEHFVDISLGGPDTLENVRPSHAWCNLAKTPNSMLV